MPTPSRRRRRLVPAAGVPGQRPRPSRRRRRSWSGAVVHRAGTCSAMELDLRAPPARRSTVRGPDRPDGGRADGGLRRHRQPGVPARATSTTSRRDADPRGRGRAPSPRCCGASRSDRGCPTPPSTPASDGRVLGAVLLSEMPPEHDRTRAGRGSPRSSSIPTRTGRGHRRGAAGPGGAAVAGAGRPDARPRRHRRQPGPAALRVVRVRRSRTSARSCSRRLTARSLRRRTVV